MAWSELKQKDFPDSYWNELWDWYDSGGDGHVAAYLMQLDLSDFDAKAPPPKTATWLAIVDANKAPEDAELADILDALGKAAGEIIVRPKAVTLEQLKRKAAGEILAWLCDRKNRRAIPHRLEECGYVLVRNPADKSDGHWKLGGKRQAVYAKAELTAAERIAAARELASSGDDSGEGRSERVEQARRSMAQTRAWRVRQ